MSNIIIIYVSFIIFNLINIISTQQHDKDVLRAVACVSLIRKLNVPQDDQRLISSYMLTCFSSIDDPTVQKLVMSKDSPKLDLDETTVKKLTDFNGLQDRFTQDQLLDFSKDLNKAFEKLRNQGGEQSSQNYRDDNNNKYKSQDQPGLLGIIIYNIFSLFTSSDSILPLIGLGAVLFLFLRQLRKLCEDNDKNESNNSSSKNKKSHNKKKIK